MRTCLILLCGCLIAGEAAVPDDAKLPPAAKTALDKLAKAEAKLDADYRKAVAAERQKALTELDKAMKTATKAGDLDAALAVKGRIEAIQKQNEVSDDELLGDTTAKRADDLAKRLVGRWQVDKQNGINAIIDFQAEGHCVATSGPFTVMGRWQVLPEHIEVLWAGDPRRWERLNFEGPDRLIGDSHDAGVKGFRGQRLKGRPPLAPTGP
jgi:hypothetical protein